MEQLKEIARKGLLRGWQDMEIYNQVYKDVAILILDLKREYLPPKKMNNKDLKLLEKINKSMKK